MHLADGIVTEPTVLVGLALAGGGAVAIAVKSVDSSDRRAVAWTGVLSAFVLAAQALNVPLLPGTSAHVIGASLVTLLLGPARAVIAMTAVVLVQAFLLGDGGIAALGVNVVDLAVLPALAVELCRRVFGAGRRGLVATAVVGTVLGNLASAACLASVLVLGAGASARVTFPWLLGAQALAGLAEGTLTALSLREVARRSPALFGAAAGDERAGASVRAAMAWVAIAVGLATALVPFRSRSPDALERVVPETASR